MSKKKIQRQPIERIEASPDTGLSNAAVEERVKKGYVNVATDPNEKTTLKIIVGNLFTFFNTVLLIIALILIGMIIYLNSIGRSDIVDSHFGFSKFVFLIPAVMNVAMGSFQEIKSLNVIKKLKIVTGTKSRVIRDGETVSVDATAIVLDDVVAVSAGDQATADLSVLSGEVDVDESMLTGESDLIKKKAGDTILSGSTVVVGSARCRAEKVGDDTYAAELTRKVKSGTRHKSELMTSIMKIIKVLTVVLCVVAATVTLTLVCKIALTGSDPSIWDGMKLSLSDPVTWTLILLTDSMFGVGIIPTGLVLTTSVALMVSIAGLTKKQTLVQELYSLENLSRVDMICLDKTGTLTDGTMSVCDVKAFIPMEEVERHMRALIGSAPERNATSEAVFQRFGADENPDIKEVIPFSSANKYSGLVYSDGKKLLMGAPDYLLEKGDERFQYVEERAKLGNRVICVVLDGELIAFIAIEDHIRDTAADTLKFFRENGVTVKVISGDSPLTVSIIAEKCGIKHADRYISLAGVPLEEIPELAEDYTVFARVSPEQKEALVTALQRKGHKVAMTGDGVNDILALRRADSSITFAKATDAAKSCSDVVLLDNDFSHLKAVVGEGRRVIGNIRKTAVLYLMKSIVVAILAFALIPLGKGQMWFSIESTYMLEAAVIGTGGFLMSLEPRRTPVRGSFMKYIVSESCAAGILAAFATLMPILLYTIPSYFGVEPFVTGTNVSPMMTVLTTLSGFVVVFAMCIPFNKYRTISLIAIIGVILVLGMLLPTAYIGGRATGSDMLAYDKAAGQTLFDSPFFREMFHPTKSPVVQSLLSDTNNYIVLRIFLFIAIPAYILVHFAAENYSRKEFKDVKKNRAFRIGRRLMLAAGFVLMLNAVFTLFELYTLMKLLIGIGMEGFPVEFYLIMGFEFLVPILDLAIGVIGYKVWKDPTRKMIRIGFIAGAVLFAVTLVQVLLIGVYSVSADNLLDSADNVIVLIVTAFYVLGSVVVLANKKNAVAGKRPKFPSGGTI